MTLLLPSSLQIHSTIIPGTYPGVDDSWSFEHFKNKYDHDVITGVYYLFICSLKVDIVQSSYEELLFDLVGVDPSIANAIRRILLAEVLFIRREFLPIF